MRPSIETDIFFYSMDIEPFSNKLPLYIPLWFGIYILRSFYDYVKWLHPPNTSDKYHSNLYIEFILIPHSTSDM